MFFVKTLYAAARRRGRAFLLAALGAAACQTPTPRQPAAADGAAAPADAAPAQRARDEAPDAHIEPVDLRGVAFVREATALRRIGSDARFVEAKGKKRQANYLTLLQRGEAIDVLEAESGFLRVKLSDETTGWVRQSAIRVGQNLACATTLSRLHCFTRPDLLAMDAARNVEPGTLLFVLREKDAFAEVDAGTAVTVWVLTDALERSSVEIEAAKIYQRASAVAARDAERAAPLFELLRNRFAATRLVSQLVPPAGAAFDAAQDANDTDAAASAPAAEPNAPPAGVDFDALSAPLAPPP